MRQVLSNKGSGSGIRKCKEYKEYVVSCMESSRVTAKVGLNSLYGWLVVPGGRSCKPHL